MSKQIRQLSAEELEDALALAWLVFSEAIASECDEEGIEEFWSMLDLEYNIQRTGDGELRFWGAFEGDALVGMCAMRELSHIHLLFVIPDYQYNGMGTSLLKKALIDCKALDGGVERVTVNALSGSQGFFESLGFKLNGEPVLGGVPFMPMKITSK